MTSPTFNYINCLKPLLRILGWQGNSRDVFEAVPYDATQIDLIDLKNIFVDLGYTCYDKHVPLKKLTRSFLPTLFVNEKQNIFWVIYEKTERDYLYIDCTTGQKLAISTTQKIKGTRYNFIKDDASKNINQNWFKSLAKRFIPDLKKPIFVSSLIALMSLTPAVLIYTSLNGNLFSQSSITLSSILVCLGLLIFSVYLLSKVKNKTLAYLSARLSILCNREALSHLLHLDADHRQNLISHVEISRLKQVDSMQNKITHLTRHLINEIPLLGVSYIALCLINLKMALVVSFAGGISVLYLKSQWSSLKAAFQTLGQEHNLYQQFLTDTHDVIDDVLNLSAHRMWTDRFKTQIADYLQAQKDAFKSLASLQSIILILLITATLGGISLIYSTSGLSGYSVANLVTSGFLLFLTLILFYHLTYHLGEYIQSTELIQNIGHWIQQGQEPKEPHKISHMPQGSIDIQNISFTYPGHDKMALQAVSIQINPGEVIAVMGQNASGKSTFVKLLMGLYSPSQGTISFDGTDISDLNIHHHRHSIGYVSSQVDLFNLSIAQNLRLAQPDVTDKEIRDILNKLDALASIEKLPFGIDTVLTPELQQTLPSALLQKINLARAFVRNCNILIFDEPTGNLDMKADLIFKNMIQNLKGAKTIIIVTHRPSVINLADQVLVLNNGIMRLFGPRAQVLKILSGNAA